MAYTILDIRHTSKVKSICFVGNHQFATRSGVRVVKIWDISKAGFGRHFDPLIPAIEDKSVALKLGPRNRLAVCFGDSDVRIVDCSTGSGFQTLEHDQDEGRMCSVEFGSHPLFAVLSMTGTVHIHNTDTNKRLHKIKASEYPRRNSNRDIKIAFGPSNLLATMSSTGEAIKI